MTRADTGRRTATDRTGLAVRAVLVVLAAALALAGTPTPVAAPALAVAVAVVAERAARLRRRGLVDAVLVAVGGTLVALVLLGLVLNYLPGGVTRTTWAIGTGVLGLAVLGGCATRPSTPSPLHVLRRRPSVITATTSVAAVFVLGAALVLSVRSFDSTTVDPLQLSVSGEVADGQARVVVSAEDAVGPLDLVVVDGDVTTVVADDLRVPAGGSLSEVVPVPDGTRVLVQLRNPGQSASLRSLVLDGEGAP